MSLKVVRSTDVINVLHPIFLLIGMPGLGKSSLGFSCERPVSLNFDSESAQARTVNRGDSINILDVEALIDLERNGHPLITDAETVIIDTVGCCIDVMAQAVTRENPKLGYGGNLTQQGWGALKKRFTAFLSAHKQTGKNLLLITHAKEKEQADATFYRPLIDGGARDYVIQQADFVGFLRMVGKERVLDFNPTESWHGKNPGQWPPLTLPAPEKARTFMAQLYAKGREALGKISDVSATIARQVDDFRADITTYTSAEQCNRAIPQIQQLSPTVKPQIATILMDHAAAKGIVFDPERKVFVEPKPNGQPVESFI